MQHSVFFKSFLPSDWGEKVSLPQQTAFPSNFSGFFSCLLNMLSGKPWFSFCFFPDPY